MKKLCRAVMLAMLVGAVIGRSTADASPIIFESATPGASQSGGESILAWQFLGVRFDVLETVTTATVGGMLGGRGSLFAAVVALTGPSDFPNTGDLSSSDVVAHTTFTLSNVSTADLSIPLVTTLNAGKYALIFGTGLFGATGEGWLSAAGATNSGTPSYFDYDGINSQYVERPFGLGRFTVTAEPVAAAVPEPASLLLLSSGIAGIAASRKRRKQQAQ